MKTRNYFKHLATRLRAATTSGTALFILLVAGQSSLLLWPWFLHSSLPYAPAGIDFLVHLIFVYVWPMMVAVGTVGVVVGAPKGGLGTHALPALPIGRRARALAEASAGLLLALAFRIACGELSRVWFGQRELVTGEAIGFPEFLFETGLGALVMLPGLLAWVSPNRPGRAVWLLPLTVALVSFAALRLGILEIPLLALFFFGALTGVVLVLPDHEIRLPGRFPGMARRTVRCARPGIDPEARLRRDYWSGPARRWGWVVAIFVLATLAVFLYNALDPLPEEAQDFYVGVVFGVSGSVIGMAALFPFGVHLMQVDRFDASDSMMSGHYSAAWRSLPVRPEAVIRGVYLHGLCVGLAWIVFTVGFVFLGKYLGVFNQLSILRFFLPLGLVIPAIAGVMTCTAVGDRIRGAIAFLALFAALPTHIGAEMGLRAVGLEPESATFYAIDLVTLALLGAAGGLPPLVHLRNLRTAAPLLCAVLGAALLATGCAAGQAAPTLDDAQRQLNVESFDLVWTTIRDRHFDPELGGVDWEGAREELRPLVAEAPTMPEARAVMDRLLARLGHSHVGIIPEAASFAAYREGDAGSRNGVPGLEARRVDDRALVSAVWNGFPAAEAGVKTGWEIVRVGDEEIRPILEGLDGQIASAFAVMDRMVGPMGGSLTIAFLDGDDNPVELELPLVEERGEIFQAGLMPPVHVWIDARQVEPGIGYVTFTNFSYPVHVMKVYNEAMESFMEAEGLVIDLRGNTGGLGDMIGWMAGWLIAEKNQSLGTMTRRDLELRFVVFPRPRTFNGPVAFLVDGLSASASELFASGMQELGRARVFGSRTAGASLPAQTLILPNGDGLIYPTSLHVTQSGRMIEGEGVIPDVEVPLTREDLLAGRDRTLETAIDWIRNQELTTLKEARER